MKNRIFIPTKIKVGFQKRSDTYTGLLGYIIYHDGKTWRKEKSWETWRSKVINTQCTYNTKINDYEIKQLEERPEFTPKEFTNELLEGFVLNKNVGGYKSGWHHRTAKCRIYDPRGFEFEITFENLLYILEHTDCISGKGLMGKFIYGWGGTELVLIPENSAEYADMITYTKLQGKKVGAKDLTEGFLYRAKEGGTYLYLGRFDFFYRTNIGNWRQPAYEDKVTKKRYFVDIQSKQFKEVTTLKFLAEEIGQCDDYAYWLGELEHHSNYSKPTDIPSYSKIEITKDYSYNCGIVKNGKFIDLRHTYYTQDQHEVLRTPGKLLLKDSTEIIIPAGKSRAQVLEEFGGLYVKNNLLENKKIKKYGYYG